MKNKQTSGKWIGFLAMVLVLGLSGAVAAESGEEGSCKSCSEPCAKDAQGVKTYPAPDKFKHQLDGVLAEYFHVQHALSSDDLEGAKKGSEKLIKALGKVDMKLLEGDAHMEWMKQHQAIKENAGGISSAGSIDKARSSFKGLSDSLIKVVECFGTSGKTAIHRVHCGMAFDNQGADWLQDKKDVKNPYYGASMLKCGSLVKTFSTGPEQKDSETKDSDMKGSEHKHE